MVKTRKSFPKHIKKKVVKGFSESLKKKVVKDQSDISKKFTNDKEYNLVLMLRYFQKRDQAID